MAHRQPGRGDGDRLPPTPENGPHQPGGEVTARRQRRSGLPAGRDRNGSPVLRALLRTATDAGVERGREREVVGVVLHELGERMTAARWREVIGWLPADVRSLAGPRQGTPAGPQDGLATAVHVATGLSVEASERATAAVVGELHHVVPAVAELRR